jgi:predicted DsbA family dithiol-disulfide isomerase
MSTAPVIEVFFDYICPWCYLGTVRTDRLRKEYGVELLMRVFPLHPETPEEGMELSELFAGRELDIEAMQVKLTQVAATEGLPLTIRTRTYNSRRAQELGKWAESQGSGDQYHRAVYRAFFVDGVNIALVDELLKIAESVGLHADEALKILNTRSFAAAVDADWQRSRDMRITSVPTHLFEGKRLAGFAPYDDFVHLIEKR